MFIKCFVISVAILALTVFLVVRSRKKRKRTKRLFTVMQLLTFGFFASVAVMYYPVFVTAFDFGAGTGAAAQAEPGRWALMVSEARTVFMTVFHTLKVFMLDGEYQNILDMGKHLSPDAYIAYSCYSVGVFCFAPILTASSILSVFKSFTSRIRYSLCLFRPMYVLSELNECSVALARSILENARNNKEKAAIFFADAYSKDEQTAPELWADAAEIGAVCLKEDITGLSFRFKFKPVSLFLVSVDDTCGLDESQNVNAAEKLTRELHHKQNINIYVYAVSDESGIILDSLNTDGNDLATAVENSIACVEEAEDASPAADAVTAQGAGRMQEESAQEEAEKEKKEEEEEENPALKAISDSDPFEKGVVRIPLNRRKRWKKLFLEMPLFNNDTQNNGMRIRCGDGKTAEDTDEKLVDFGFLVRRVNPIRNLAMETMQSLDPFALSVLDPYTGLPYEGGEEAVREKRSISILVLGQGAIGREFVKTALWYCQLADCALKITVVDHGVDSKGGARSAREHFEASCPEIIPDVEKKERGDCNYDIKFFQRVDCFSSSFENFFKDNEDRLSDTKMVFVTLGDDDKNLAVAVNVRRIFDRMKPPIDENDRRKPLELPLISAVVFDDQKNENLNAVTADGGRSGGLVDYSGKAYNVRIIGSLSEQFSRTAVDLVSDIDGVALSSHVEWIFFAERMRKQLYNNATTLSKVFEYRRSCCGDEQARREFDEKYTDGKGGIGEGFIDSLFSYEKSYFKKDGRVNTKLCKDIKKFLRYEYYRDSSRAKEAHRRMLLKNFPDEYKCLEAGEGAADPYCECANCNNRRVTEHMRWNMYMRTHGYRHAEERNDRAKLHNRLVAWDDLDMIERYKD